MTQRSDAGEALTRGSLVSSQALYHWATAVPRSGMKQDCTQFALLILCHDSTGCDEMGDYFAKKEYI